MITAIVGNVHKHYDTNKPYKLIFSVGLCRHLLRKGFSIVDVTEHNSESRLVFVFKNTELLHYAIDEYTESTAKED